MTILHNGVLSDSDRVGVDIASAHFNFGSGFFETILWAGGMLERYDAHIARLKRSCEDFGLILDSGDLREDAIHSLLEATDAQHSTMRVKIAAVPLSVGSNRCDSVVSALPYTRVERELRVVVNPAPRGDEPMHRYKCINYAANLYWKKHWAALGFDEVLFLSPRDEIIEGSFTNVGFVKDDVLHLVGAKEFCLGGVMQAWVEEDPAAFGFKAVIRCPGGLLRSDIDDADRVVLMNSLMGVRTVGEVSWPV